MKIPEFVVLVRAHDAEPDAEPVEHTVRVLNGDQLRAELEGPRIGLPSMRDAPMNYSTLWIWASLVRQRLYAGSAAAFVRGSKTREPDCVAFEPVRDDDRQRLPGDPEDPDGDPTRRAVGTDSP